MKHVLSEEQLDILAQSLLPAMRKFSIRIGSVARVQRVALDIIAYRCRRTPATISRNKIFEKAFNERLWLQTSIPDYKYR